MTLADLDCERALLGALLMRPDLIPQAIAAGLAPDTFAAPGTWAAFAAQVRLGPAAILARPCSAIAEELDRAGDLGLIGGPAGIATMILEALPPHLVGLAVERLVGLGAARRVQNVLREALDRVERDPAMAGAVLARLRGAR